MTLYAVPLSLLAAHFVGDWLLQSDKVAVGKGKSIGTLFWHVGTVTFVLACWLVLCRYEGSPSTTGFLLTNFLLHVLIDAVTSQFTARWFFFKQTLAHATDAPLFSEPDEVVWIPIPENRGWFFKTIGFDQLLHFASYSLTLWWLQ